MSRRGVPLPLSTVPALRISCVHEEASRPDGDYILYWMTAFRRARYNFAMQRALEWAHEFRKPLVVLEALRVDYPWASDRLHRFVLDGMADNRADFAKGAVTSYQYVEPEHGAGKGLLRALPARACAVVTDNFPGFFLPAATAAAAAQLHVPLEKVDSNGMHALRAPGKEFKAAHAFRRWLQKNVYEDLASFPLADPLAGSEAGAVQPRAARARLHRRSALERGADRAIARWRHPRLPENAVGQEDPRMVPVARGGARPNDPPR